ncbi:O-antigen ligase family protein [Lysobacter sp. D1-1-M9]|uniref:O-antigen ligase family protein n=1 Tax=Novilysobacter longmucuonensis TaxID=3098603 RepID=UPI002FC6F7DB
MLRLLFAIAIVLLPNALHVSVDTGIPGLNFSNLLLLVLIGALLISAKEPRPALAGPGYLSAPLIALFLVLGLGFVIAQWSEPGDLMEDLTRLKNAIFYPILYFVYRRCRLGLKATRQLIMLVLLVAVVAGLEAVYQGVQFGLGQYVDSERASGPFGGPEMANRAGVFYAFFLPLLAAAAVLMTRPKAVRMAAIGGCVVLAAAIMLTYSRQSYLIAVFGLLMLLMHLMRRKAMVAMVAGLMLLVSVGLFPDSVVQRVQETRQVDAAGAATLDSSTASRFDIWSGAVKMWSDHPAGVGLGRFATNIGEYSSHVGMDAHNTYVLMLAETGPLGLAALLWVFWRLWGLGRRLRESAASTDLEAQALALGFRIAVVSVALSNIYGSAFFEGLIMASFWVLCGLLERYYALKAHAANELAEEQQPAEPVGIRDRFPLAARALPGAGRPFRTAPRTYPR